MSHGPRASLTGLHDFEESLMNLTLAGLANHDSAIPPSKTEEKLHKARLTPMCGPAMRNFLLHKALQSKQEALADNGGGGDGDHNNSVSIMYETAALSIWTLWKFQSVEESARRSRQLKTYTLSDVVDAAPDKQPTKTLISLCRSKQTLAGDDDLPAPQPVPKNVVAKPSQDRILSDKLTITGDMIARCRRLPPTWHVVQLCKQYNMQHAFQIGDERICAALPLNLTLFAYARSELLDGAPLQVTLPAAIDCTGRGDGDDVNANIFKRAWEMSHKVNKALSMFGVDEQLPQFLKALRAFLGPWTVFFFGKARSYFARQTERLAFGIVDRTLAAAAAGGDVFTRQQRVLCSLVGRAILMLGDSDRIAAASLIAQSAAQYELLLGLFVHDLPAEIHAAGHLRHATDATFTASDFYPTILVIDELLDHVYWEMVVPQLECTRIGSLALLFKLADHYATGIDAETGALAVRVDSGLVLSNPDGTLPNLETRLQLMCEHLLPEYRRVCGRPPKDAEMAGYLADTDVYVYSGHGNGLQFIGGTELVDSCYRCVTFLYGCESVALKTAGLQSEPVGAHLYLQHAMCPLVVGMLNVVTDVWTDVVTLGVARMWLNQREHGVVGFAEKWKAQMPHERHEKASQMLMEMGPRAHLLEVLQTLRCMRELPLKLRVSMVARGIPVCVVKE